MTSTEAGLKDSLNSLIGSNVWLLLTKVSNFLEEQDIKSYVVGGLVRDVLLRRDTADIDLAIAADALEIAPQVAAALEGKYVLLDRANKVGRVVLVDKEKTSAKVQWELDFSTFKGSIEQDLARRDFTIDAMAIDLESFLHSPPSSVYPSEEKGIRGFPDGNYLILSKCHGWEHDQYSNGG